MNEFDNMRINKLVEHLEEKGKISGELHSISRELTLKSLPELLVVLSQIKSENKELADFLMDGVIVSTLLSYCSNIDEAIAMLNRMKDSLYRFDKTLNSVS
jgi:hypothetical protein